MPLLTRCTATRRACLTCWHRSWLRYRMRSMHTGALSAWCRRHRSSVLRRTLTWTVSWCVDAVNLFFLSYLHLCEGRLWSDTVTVLFSSFHFCCSSFLVLLLVFLIKPLPTYKVGHLMLYVFARPSPCFRPSVSAFMRPSLLCFSNIYWHTF